MLIQVKTYVAAIIAGLLTLCVSQVSAVEEPAKVLKAEVEILQADYKAADTLKIRFTLTNNTDWPLSVLKWFTPLDGFKSDMFQVEDESGKRLPYLGILIKRGSPTEEDYVLIGPGQSVSTEVDISEAYDISQAGRYKVMFTSNLISVGRESPATLIKNRIFRPRELHSNSVILKILEPRQPKIRPFSQAPKAPSAKKGATFDGCSTEEENTVADGLSQAVTYVDDALSCLGKKLAVDRYTNWFGTYDTSRFSTIVDHFNKIRTGLTENTIKFTCHGSCSNNTWAYVGGENYIVLCPQYWSHPLVGTDSKGGTVVHEASHLYANTRDWIYQPTGAMDLADNDPSKAIENADNHEYFAENDPARSCELELVDISPWWKDWWKIIAALIAAGLITVSLWNSRKATK